MEFLVLGVAVVLLSFVIGGGLLVVFINLGVFPSAQQGDLARKLYWRKERSAGSLVLTATPESIIAALAEGLSSAPQTDRDLFLWKEREDTHFDFFPANSSGREELIRAA